jgi:hypothetical protein
MKLCRECGVVLDEILQDVGLHPACELKAQAKSKFQFAFPQRSDGITSQLGVDLKDEFSEMIKWSEANRPRSLQTSIGPSQLGDPCDRKFGYLMAGVPAVVTSGGDPWPAFVGSAIHSRLEDVVRKWQQAKGGDWEMEERVQASNMVTGRYDLYSRSRRLLVDAKSAGPDMLEKVRKNGPPNNYLVQIMTYGHALIKAGKPVDNVAFLFVPRSGWLRSMFVWTAAYDPKKAAEGLSRPDRMGKVLTDLDVLNFPQRWEQVPAEPSYLCEWCPWHNWRKTEFEPADDKGCSGKKAKS